MSKHLSVNDLIQSLQLLVNHNPKFGNLPIIYSNDDEGNSYQKIYNSPVLTQVENIDEYYLEVVGFYDEDSDEIALEDVNCVIIN